MKKVCILICFMAIGMLPTYAMAQDSFDDASTLSSPVPIPLSEQNLPTVEAKPLKIVNSANHTLEGAVFDRSG